MLRTGYDCVNAKQNHTKITINSYAYHICINIITKKKQIKSSIKCFLNTTTSKIINCMHTYYLKCLPSLMHVGHDKYAILPQFGVVHITLAMDGFNDTDAVEVVVVLVVIIF